METKQLRRRKTRDAEIFVYPDGSFYFRGYIKGRRYEKKLDADSFGEAKERKDEFVKLTKATGQTSGKLRVDSLLRAYKLERELEFRNGDIRDRTIKEMRTLVKLHIEPHFGGLTLEKAKSDEVWSGFVKKKRSMDMMNMRKVWVHFLNWCKSKKFLDSVPRYKIPNWTRRERRPLEPHEVIAIFANLSSNVRDVCLISLFTGMRISEVSQLSWDRVDIQNMAIVLNRENTKTKKRRIVVFNNSVLAILERRLSLSKSPFVFPNQRNKNRPTYKSSYSKQWREALLSSKLGVHLTPHDLRATYETAAHLTPGLTKTQMEKQLGSSMKVQQDTYVKLAADKLRPMGEVVSIPGINELIAPKNGGNNGGNNKFKRSKRARSV